MISGKCSADLVFYAPGHMQLPYRKRQLLYYYEKQIINEGFIRIGLNYYKAETIRSLPLKIFQMLSENQQ